MNRQQILKILIKLKLKPEQVEHFGVTQPALSRNEKLRRIAKHSDGNALMDRTVAL